MNLLLVEAHEVSADGIVELVDRRADHLRKVLKVEVGQTLKIGLIDGGRGKGRVVDVTSDAILIEMPPDLDAGDRETRPEIDIILALPRPQALHRFLQTVATMSVRRLDLLRSWRVEKSFFGSPSLSPESIRKHLLLGAEQGMVTRLPEVGIHTKFRPFLESFSADGRDSTEGDSAQDGTLRLLTHPGAPQAIEEVVARASAASSSGMRRWVIAIGPEGGWIDREVESFEELGFHSVHLGPWILKVENALTATLAQLELLYRWLPTNPRRSGDDLDGGS